MKKSVLSGMRPTGKLHLDFRGGADPRRVNRPDNGDIHAVDQRERDFQVFPDCDKT